MTNKTVKLLVLIALLVHGIGHMQGVISGMGVKLTSNTGHISWLLKGMGTTPNRILCIILYLGAAITAILAGLAFKDVLLPESTWQILALIAAFFSTASLLLFPNALAMFFNKAGAIGVNLIIYYSILFHGNWPTAVFED